MKKPWTVIFLSIGLVLTFCSSQDSYFKEFIYDMDMNRKYDITELNEMYRAIPTQYIFAGKTIDTTHRLLKETPYKDSWDNTIQLGDIFITVDGEQVAKLEAFPIEELQSGLTVKGLNQYGSLVSYWRVFDKETEQETFAVVIQTTREIIKDNMEGYIPNEKQEYKLITVSENGEVKREDFSFKTKSKLQTKLIPLTDEGEVGYYISSKSLYPSIFIFLYPFLFPFGTFITGFVTVLLTLYLLFQSLIVRNKA